MKPRVGLIGLLFMLHLPVSVISQSRVACSRAPSATIRFLCSQLDFWTQAAAQSPVVQVGGGAAPVAPPGASPLVVPLAAAGPTPGDIYTCQDLNCACLALQGSWDGTACTLSNGYRMGPAQRVEYRMMTDDQRMRFHTAMWTLKNSGEYDTLARIHGNAQVSASAHGGPAFFPWHREYIKRFEFALRRIDPSVAIPYWDGTLESALPTPSDSVLFSNVLMGDTDSNGAVNSGAFRGWTQLDGTVLQRTVGRYGSPFTPTDIANLLAQTDVSNVLAYTAPSSTCPVQPNFNAFEYAHGNPHIWVGGAMLQILTSTGDPMFWLHHSFVDLCWELWRQSRQTYSQRATQYPPDLAACEQQSHFSNSIMFPFGPMINLNGLANTYTPGLYTYGNRPSCSLGPDCGSQYLFCDYSHGQARCASKVKEGGNCNGGYFNGEAVCYQGVCQNGVCVTTTATTQPPIQTTTPISNPTETCYNENQCCGPWAQNGECTRNPGYMNVWCKASCNQCRPTTYDITIECGDRSVNCGYWSNTGECRRNPQWMAENCRQSCNLCGSTRAQACGQRTTTTAVPCNSPGCFNENICCSTWQRAGFCSSSPAFMTCNCRVSCGVCTPDYPWGTCADYSDNCGYWQSIGECSRNPWMRENCRQSCNTCYSRGQLQQICRTSRRAPGVSEATNTTSPAPPFKGSGMPAQRVSVAPSITKHLRGH